MAFRVRTLLIATSAIFLFACGSTPVVEDAAKPMVREVVFDPDRPQPAPPGDVLDPETLLTPPEGFRIQRRNNFYRLDETGGLYRWANTGHWSNYDEAEATFDSLPDPLVMADGTPVTTAAMWNEQRRAELIDLYETEIYGKVPANAPSVSWEVTSDENDGTTIRREVLGKIGDWPEDYVAPDPKMQENGRPGRYEGLPRIRVSLTIPASATGPVPMIFGASGRRSDPEILQSILDRSWGYGTINIRDVQIDSRDLESLRTGTVGMMLTEGKDRPRDEWGILRAWAWGYSNAMDYFETDADIDETQIAISGHSRGGKTVLLAAAIDERFAMVFPTCAGEMGTSLSRRDWGETIDDMAQLLAPQFAGNFTKYAANWDKLPVDSHMLMALMAPRPIFATGGTTDQWSDPTGVYLAAQAASPVYELLGKKGLGIDEKPPADTAIVTGEVAFHEHTGGHVVTPKEWQHFLKYADVYFTVN